MAKVTSKRQLTVPKVIADQYDIRAGDDLQWVAAGETIRVIPVTKRKGRAKEAGVTLGERLELFDKATTRQGQRQSNLQAVHKDTRRGWKREDLYRRGVTD